jgi:hypothetical protein
MSIRGWAAAIISCSSLTACASGPPLPIIDMHMHAQAADFNGPPPLAICTPFPEYPVRDPQKDFGAVFMKMLKNPTCPDPVWSPTTDAGVMEATFEVLRRRNIIGVFSGSEATVRMIPRSSPIAVRGPGYRNLDLAVMRRVPLAGPRLLELRAEVFNATNTPPLGNPNTTVGAAAFGTITSAGDPRVVQLALKFLF